MLRCLLATLGKDAPGVNAALRAATRVALHRGFEVVGARRGFPGILEGDLRPLKESDVGFILGKGGSLLGSVDFRVAPSAHETLDRIAAALKKFDLVVVTGGLGSFSIMSRVYALHDMGFTTTMFIPASVENELLNPAPVEEAESRVRGEREIHAEAIGADTAANTAIEAIDRLREQSYLTRTVFLIQLIGVKSNFLPIQVGLACGAHRIYLPPYPALTSKAKAEIQEMFGESFEPNRVDMKELVEWIDRMFNESKKTYLVIIIPSGIPLGQVVSGDDEDEKLRGKYEHLVSSMVPIELTAMKVVEGLMMHYAGNDRVHTRYVVLDDLQRGGAPSLRDRMLGSIYGEAAVVEFLSVIKGQDLARRGNLNLLEVSDTCRASWRCHPRAAVLPLFSGPNPRAGGVDPLPFFRQSRGTVSGYRRMTLA